MLLYVFLFIFYAMLIYLCFVLSLVGKNSSAPVPRRMSSSSDAVENDEHVADNLRKRRGFENKLGLSKIKKNDSPIENNFVFLGNDSECTDTSIGENSMSTENVQDINGQVFEKENSTLAKNSITTSDDELLHNL